MKHRNEKIEKLLSGLIILGSLYLVFESILHVFNIRLLDAESVWPVSALAFSRLIDQIYGSFALLLSVTLFEIQKDLAKYKRIIIIFAFWSLSHAVFLIYTSLNNNFKTLFNPVYSLAVWSALYNQYLLLEAFLLIFFSLVVFLWVRKK